MKYRSEIDGLRAIAVVPVILHHAGFDAFGGGFVGVDVFFVISGYLITTIIINELSEGKFSLLKFYERRARRILPALFFVVLCCIPVAWFLLLPSDLTAFAHSLVAVSTFSSNILFWLESGYFATASALKPLLHTWSLAVEEQFYILFPLFLIVTWKFGKRAIVWTLIALFVISLAAAQWGAYNEPTATYFLLPTRAWELLLGSFAAFYLRRNVVATPHWISNILSAIGLAAILYAVFAFDQTTPFPSLYALIPTVGAVLVILFTLKGTYTHTLLSLRGVVGVGLISYSLYLWHQPMFAFWRHYNVFESTHTQMLFLSFLCVPFALFTYRFVEVPFRGKEEKLNRSEVFILSGTVISILFMVGISGRIAQGYPNRFNGDELRLINSASFSPLRSECHFLPENSFSASESCRYFGNDRGNWAILGNSHGVELAYGVASVLEERGDSLYHFTVSGCSASFDLDSKTYCGAFFQSRIKYILQSETINNVLLAFRSELSGIDSAKSLMHLANHFHRSGKEVYLVLQAPTLPSHISRFIHRALESDDVTGSMLSKELLEWKGEYADVLESLHLLDKEVNVIDLSEIFCDQTYCYAIRGGVSLYFDDNHMSAEAARLSAAYMFQSIK